MSAFLSMVKRTTGLDLPDIDFNKALNLTNILPSDLGDVVELWSTIEAVKNGTKTQKQLNLEIVYNLCFLKFLLKFHLKIK